LFGANREFEIFFGDTVLVLVNHYDTEKHAQCEEEVVDIVLYSIADGSRGCKQKNLGNDGKCSAKDNVANRPAIIKGTEDKNELRDNVDNDTDNAPEDVDHPKSNNISVEEAGETLKDGSGDEEGNAKYCKAGEAENPERETDRGVLSSTNWKPTKPLMRLQQYVAATRLV
jgi:hypothetical protein